MANNGCDIKFSILIPVYNVEIHWLERAIESVVQQQYSNWELCIVDDCSTDESVKVYLRTIRDSRIKIKYQEKNGGISEATNEAAAMANGEYLVLMDNDDEISQDALLEFAKAISKSNADIIYSDQDIVIQKGTTESHTVSLTGHQIYFLVRCMLGIYLDSKGHYLNRWEDFAQSIMAARTMI